MSVGGSYPGALSAWFREKYARPQTLSLRYQLKAYSRYPSVVDVAISSSGVVAATKHFVEFDMQVRCIFFVSQDTCFDILLQG